MVLIFKQGMRELKTQMADAQEKKHQTFIPSSVSSRNFSLGWKWTWQLHASYTMPPINVLHGLMLANT